MAIAQWKLFIFYPINGRSRWRRYRLTETELIGYFIFPSKLILLQRDTKSACNEFRRGTDHFIGSMNIESVEQSIKQRTIERESYVLFEAVIQNDRDLSDGKKLISDAERKMDHLSGSSMFIVGRQNIVCGVNFILRSSNIRCSVSQRLKIMLTIAGKMNIQALRR